MKAVHFGEEANHFLRTTLEGGLPLAKLLSSLPIDTGVCSAFLPDGVSYGRAVKFSEGWINITEFEKASGVVRSLEPEWDGEYHSLAFVQHFLTSHDNAFAIFEDPVGRASDSFQAHQLENLFFSEEHVYHFARGRHSSVAEVQRMSHGGRRFPMSVGALGVGSFEFPASGDHADSKLLSTLVRAVDHILLGIYDLEADLIWSRPGLTL